MASNAQNTSRIWTEDHMQKAIKAHREGRSQRHAAELYGVPHSCLQHRQDKLLRSKRSQITFSKEQEELVSRLLKFSAGFVMDCITVKRAAFDYDPCLRCKKTIVGDIFRI